MLFVLTLHFNSIHSAPTNVAERAYLFILQTGMLSMEVFFVISGFLITGILLRSKGAKGYLRVFYVRRALRILPLYYCFIALWFLLVPRLDLPNQFDLIGSWRSQLFYWFHSSNVLWALRGWAPDTVNHFWSLSVEEQFYLVWPLIVMVCDARRLRSVCLGLIVAAPILRVIVVFSLSNEAAYTMAFGRMDSLALGALLAVVSREPRGLDPLVPWARAGAVSMFAIAAAMAFKTGEFGPGVTLYNTVGLTISSFLAVSVVILGLTHRFGRVGNYLLTKPPLTTLGRYCYGMYVLHKPLRLLLEHYGLSYQTVSAVVGEGLHAQAVVTALMMLISFALAWVAWHALEKQFLKLKVFFPYGKPASASAQGPGIQAPAVAGLPVSLKSTS